MDFKKLNHDLNSVFSKIETSIDLLQSELSEEEKKQVISILNSSIKKLKAVSMLTLMINPSKDYHLESLNLKQILGLKRDFTIYADRKIFLLVVDILKSYFGELKVYIKGEKVVIELPEKDFKELDRFILNNIKSVLKLIHVELNVSKNILEIEKENENTDNR